MRRNSITVNESGNIIMPENVSNIWMSEPELVELFGVIAPTLRSAIRNTVSYTHLTLPTKRIV